MRAHYVHVKRAGIDVSIEGFINTAVPFYKVYLCMCYVTDNLHVLKGKIFTSYTPQVKTMHIYAKRKAFAKGI
jgi:hypothetical protein